MAGGHHHRSGPLKQANKQHKVGKHLTKTRLAVLQGGKIESHATTTASASKASSMQARNKATRVLRQKQLRQQHREDVVLSKRFGTGSRTGAPKIVAVVALGDAVDMAAIQHEMLQGAAQLEVAASDALANATIAVFPQHKQKLAVIACGNGDLLAAMDAAKVADLVVFVLAVQDGMDHALNRQGVKILSAIRSQGLPSPIGCIQGLDKLAAKAQSDAKKVAQRFFETEFGDSVKVVQHHVHNQLGRTVLTLAPRPIHWRDARSYMHASAAAFTPNEDGPSDLELEHGTLAISGYLRGKPMSVNQLIHITDVGTFQLSRITQGHMRVVPVAGDDASKMASTTTLATAAGMETEMELARADPSVQEDLRMEAEFDPFASEQTWPTKEELEEAERHAREETKTKVAAGMSEYQAAWVGDDDEGDANEDAEMKDEEEEDAAVDQAFCKTGTDDASEDEDVEDMYGNDNDDDLSMEDENDQEREQHLSELQETRRQERENAEFPDEVDAPTTSSARTRFARYRGLKSVRSSYWDPKESLPRDYARLFQFEDFAMVQRMAMQRGKDAERVMKAEWKRKNSVLRSRASSMGSSAMQDDETASVGTSASSTLVLPSLQEHTYVTTGAYVTLHVQNVPRMAFERRVQAGPLILGALLKHENRLSVLNFTIQRAPEASELPIKSKERMVFHCGFRRYAGRPIYSDQSLKSDQHLFHRFLPASGWCVATVFAPVTFQPASVLIFRDDSDQALVATGTLLSVNPDRVVLKRAILTGTPVKVKKRKAVVRYMFHSPEDVRWFKPVELFTKHGMTGHIRESLGTHGDLKAVFNKPVQQHDTICMPLYKRVYPKFVE